MGLEFIFKQPFPAQVAFFRGKLGNLIPTESWLDVQKSAHDTGFMVAGAMKTDLLADLAGAVDQAISEGTGIEAFRKNFDQIVEKHGWSYKGEYNWRTRTIYRTNMASSYSAGRLVQLKSGNFSHWMYRHNDSVARPRPLHVSWNGLTLPADDAWWNTHYPPNGWGCQCYVVGVSESAARRLGGRLEPAPDDGFTPDGRPKGIDKGWDYQPGATTVDQIRRTILDKTTALPASIGARMAGAILSQQIDAVSNEFYGFVDDALVNQRGTHMVVGSLHPAWVDAAKRYDVLPESAEISVRDVDVKHTFRDSKREKLDLSWYRSLPRHLLSPSAVVLDLTHSGKPAFMLLFDQTNNSNKLVVRVNYKVKKLGELNIVETGKPVDPSGIKAMLGHGYVLIDGAL